MNKRKMRAGRLLVKLESLDCGPATRAVMFRWVINLLRVYSPPLAA
ncbi:MAG TPA: hypothetical protein PKK23_13660 [Nitrospirales bacterium]|nr:hypothetical protein [Nitrospirales bacterium]